MSSDGNDRSDGDGSMDEGSTFDPFRGDDDPLQPRPPLRDPFAQRPSEQQPDPFSSQEDPFGLPDPFQPAAPPFDPRRDYIDPFQPEAGTFQPEAGPARPAGGQPGGGSWGAGDHPRGGAQPPAAPRPQPGVDPFAPAQQPSRGGQPAPGPAQPFGGVPPFDDTAQGFPPGLPEEWSLPPRPASTAPEPPPGPYDYGATEQRSQAPVPNRAARHQAKRRLSWRPSRGPAGSPPAGPPGGVGPAGGVPPVDGEPAPGGPAGAGSPGSPFEPAETFPTAEPFEPDGWRPASEPAQPSWPSPPANGGRAGFPEHAGFPQPTEPFSEASNGERLEPATLNGSTGREAAPAWHETRARRGRVPESPRVRPSIPKLEVPSGLARSGLGLAAILVVAALGLGAVSTVLPEAKRPPAPATAAPYSARWVCPTLPGQATSVNMANVGSGAAALRTTVVSGAEAGQPARRSLAAGTTSTVKVPASREPGYVQVEAFSAPVVVSAGAQAGCAPGPTDRLWIPTSDTSLGASTSVVIANPDAVPASVDLVPHLVQGSQQAVAEVFVPPHSAVTKPFSYGELVGLKPAIEVIAKSGRVVASAVIAQKDKQKVYIPAQTTTKSEWSFAGGLAGTDRSTFVLITNPSATPLSVSVLVTTDRGNFKPGNDFDNPVPGGAAVAVQVPPLRVGGSGAFAVRIRSRGDAPFVAALRVTTPTAAGTTSYVDLGTSDTDTRWLVPAVPASRQVVLANLGGDALRARLAGSGSGSGSGGTVQVGAGKVVVRNLPAGLKSIEVTTDQAGLLVAPLGTGLAMPGAVIGGLPPGGPIVADAAAP